MAVGNCHVRALACVLFVLSACAVSALNCKSSDDNLDPWICPALADCDESSGQCVCAIGAISNGQSGNDMRCSANGWAVRLNIIMSNETERVPQGQIEGLAAWNESVGYNVEQYARLMFNSGETLPDGFLTSMQHSMEEVEGNWYLTINALFPEDDDEKAYAAAAILAGNMTAGAYAFGVDLSDTTKIPVEPRVYRWALQTTDGPLQIKPTGMEVTSVFFKPNCAETGCWVIGITYSTGENNFNTLFIPRAELPNETLSYDYDYDSARNSKTDVNWLNWGKTPVDTFVASNFPCRSTDYDPTAVHTKSESVAVKRNPSPPDQITSCCLPEFFDMYRPIEDFVNFFEEHPRARVRKDRCDGGLVETWHRPDWPNPFLDPPIPPKWTNDGDWKRMDCMQDGLWLVHQKLNSRDRNDAGYYFQRSNPRAPSTRSGWEDEGGAGVTYLQPTQGTLPCNCPRIPEGSTVDDSERCVREKDSRPDTRIFCESDLPRDGQGIKWMKEEECFFSNSSETEGSLDMGCYDDGEVKTWIFQPAADFAFDMDSSGEDITSVQVTSPFGVDKMPVVIIDVLSLSLEDQNDGKISDRWDALQIGICKNGQYERDRRKSMRDSLVKQCMGQSEIVKEPTSPTFITDKFAHFSVPKFSPDCQFDWQAEGSLSECPPQTKLVPQPETLAKYVGLTGGSLRGASHFKDKYQTMNNMQFIDAINATNQDITEVPGSYFPDTTCSDDCLWDYKFCLEYVDFAFKVGFMDQGPPEAAKCSEILWETGQTAETHSNGVVMPAQTGVRGGFRIIACTGSAIVKFVSDAHSAHSTGFTINWRVVPHDEVSDWTGDKYGFNQGGWTCPTEPFFPHDTQDIPDEFFDRGQVITEDMTLPGTTNPRAPYVTGNVGMAFPPAVQESVGDWLENANAFCDKDEIERIFGDVSMVPAYHDIPPDFLKGRFADMNHAWAEFTTVLDPYIKQYKATVYLDDKELREKAGILRGTVGVEYSIDTFIGLANFKPTNTKVLDPFATQVALHLEKNNFFAVSTHGVNEYTFLEYVNMRLVTIYPEDSDLLTETTDEFGDVTNRVASGKNEAQYVQVTFTLGDQYEPIETGLIPLDSVVVSKGTFIEAAATTQTRQHVCDDWDSDALKDQTFIEEALLRDCAPNAAMCTSPESIPDQFVVFNIPLGVDWLPPASQALDENVFVELVVSAIDTDVAGGPRDPLSGPPGQMKTTLTGSIPVVRGGINIFCDGLVAKTDLTEVVKVDIVVGTANSTSELSRLRILKDVQSSDLFQMESQSIETDSIESGLMTFVVNGSDSYFGLGGTGGYAVQLEDVITIHIMESSDAMFETVKTLVATPGDDNRDSNGVIDTDGYELNQAFRFRVNRKENRAHLEPTQALLNLCPFRPPRPTAADPFPTTCVTRRDIQGKIPTVQTGSVATAIELNVRASDGGDNEEAGFMKTILGANDFADDLGRTFSTVVSDTYGFTDLNKQYKRAWWINPGYEWTPTQTGGQSIFTISQKFVLFALVNLDEGFSSGARRRALLQASSDTKDTGAGLGGAMVVYQTSPASLLAQAYGTSLSQVATYKVGVQLTQDEACMSENALRKKLTATFQDYTKSAASSTETVQVVGITVDKKGVQCGRRTTRKLLATFSDATAEADMVMVFTEGKKAMFNPDAFKNMAGITSVEAVSVSEDITTDVEYVNLDVDTKPGSGSDADSGSSNVGLIVGCAVGGAVLLGLLGFIAFRFMGQREEEEAAEVAGVTVRDLKAQLTIQQPSSGRLPSSGPMNQGGGAGPVFMRPPSIGTQGSHGNMFGSHGNVYGDMRASSGNMWAGSQGNVFGNMQGSLGQVQMAPYVQAGVVPQQPLSGGIVNYGIVR